MMDNKMRAGRVALVLAAGGQDNDVLTDLLDFLADTRHFCARAGIDPDEA